MNRLSLRRAVNRVYLHLLAQRSHHEKCTANRCVAGCDVAAFHRVLEEPLLPSEALRVAAEQERAAALIRGEIPA